MAMPSFGSRSTPQQIDRMRQYRQDDAQIFNRTAGAAWQIDDQRATADACHGTREHGVRCYRQAG